MCASTRARRRKKAESTCLTSPYDADGEFLVVCGEVKLPDADLQKLAISTENKDQIGRYLAATRAALISNIRSFALVTVKPGWKGIDSRTGATASRCHCASLTTCAASFCAWPRSSHFARSLMPSTKGRGGRMVTRRTRREHRDRSGRVGYYIVMATVTVGSPTGMNRAAHSAASARAQRTFWRFALPALRVPIFSG